MNFRVDKIIKMLKYLPEVRKSDVKPLITKKPIVRNRKHFFHKYRNREKTYFIIAQYGSNNTSIISSQYRATRSSLRHIMYYSKR